MILLGEQGTAEWHQQRIGRITSTVAAAIMTKGRKQGEMSQTAKSEIYRLKAERNLRAEFKGDRIGEYLERIGFNSRAIEFGRETEAEARRRYEISLNVEVKEVSFITAEGDLEDFWGDSPDGVILPDTRIEGVLEIKCPKPATAMEYFCRFSEGEGLKTIEPKYYWQVINHLAVSGARYCDFVVYDPMQKNGFLRVRYYAETPEIKADIEALTEQVRQVIKTL